MSFAALLGDDSGLGAGRDGVPTSKDLDDDLLNELEMELEEDGAGSVQVSTRDLAMKPQSIDTRPAFIARVVHVKRLSRLFSQAGIASTIGAFVSGSSAACKRMSIMHCSCARR